MSEDEVKLLNIKKLEINDTGDYLCRVLNEYGYADLIHHLTVLPGKYSITIIYSSTARQMFSSSKASERPSLLTGGTKTTRRFLSNSLQDELLISIGCVIAIMVLLFIIFIIYHIRNRKSLRRTLLATRILATRGITTLKSVRQLNSFYD